MTSVRLLKELTSIQMKGNITTRTPAEKDKLQ